MMKSSTLLFWLFMTVSMNIQLHASSGNYGNDGVLVATNKDAPEFSNLSPGKSWIKKYQNADSDGHVDFKDFYKQFTEEGYTFLENEPDCYEKSSDIDFSGGPCDYPENFGLIKSDDGFEDGETRYVYLKVKGPVCCGEILVNPKAAKNCYSDLRITGPAVLSEDGVDRTSLTEIGTYNPDCVSGLDQCEDGKDYIYEDGHKIWFEGWESTGGGYSIWYYKVKSASGKGTHAISHLTFALVESKVSCTPLNSLGSLVWNDLNKNGLYDAGTEAGVEGIKVILYKDGNPTGQFQFTNENGHYLFTGLADGEYQVKFEKSGEYEFTMPNQGNGHNDSKAHRTTGMSDMVNLSGGMDYMYSDAGLVFSILPIILSDFKAEGNENTVILTWETASEVQSDYFEVQKSVDGFTFQTISMVEASNYSSSRVNYRSKDEAPHPGTNFYRLKLVDLDGSYTYSDVRSVSLDVNSQDLSVFPNPFNGEVTIRHGFNRPVQGSIYNAAGVEVRTITLGRNQSVLDLHSLDSGLYYILLRDGRHQKAVKLVKQ